MSTRDGICRILTQAALLILVMLLPSRNANAQTAGYNLDFEHWHADRFGKDRLDQWDHIGWGDDTLYQLQGTKRSTQSYSGAYAVTVNRWYIIDRDAIRLRQGISHKPRFLNGYYSYTETALAKHADSPTVNDIATVTAYFTGWNAALRRPDTIGYGYLELAGAASYTPFSCPVTYTTAGQPDSVSIYIRPSKFFGIGCKYNPDCSFLTVDDLSFADVTSIASGHAADAISVSPNPVRKELSIHVRPGVMVRRIELVDVTGKIVMRHDGAAPQIQLEHIHPGHYFLKIQTSDGAVVRKITIE